MHVCDDLDHRFQQFSLSGRRADSDSDDGPILHRFTDLVHDRVFWMTLILKINIKKNSSDIKFSTGIMAKGFLYVAFLGTGIQVWI